MKKFLLNILIITLVLFFKLKIKSLDAAQAQAQILIQNGPDSYITSVKFSPNGKYIISSSDKFNESGKGKVYLWDTYTKKQTKVIIGDNKNYFTSIDFDPNNNFFIAGSDDNTIRLWYINSDEEKIFPGHTKKINSVCISPDGKHLASGSDDNTIRLWDINNGKEIEKFKKTLTGKVTCVCFTPDGKHIVSGSDDNTIRLWDINSDEEKIFPGHTKKINSVCISPDGKHIVSGSDDNTIRLWDINNGKEIEKIKKTLTGKVTCVCISPDGKYIISGSDDKTIRLWDINNGKEIKEFRKTLTGKVTCVCFSPDGKQIVSGSDDNTIRLWDINNKENNYVFKNITCSVNSVAFSENGRLIISVVNNKTIRIWELNKELNKIEQVFNDNIEKNSIKPVNISPCGKYAFSMREDYKIYKWKLSILNNVLDFGKPFKIPPGNFNSFEFNKVKSIDCSPVSNDIVLGTSDGKIGIWGENGELIEGFYSEADKLLPPSTLSVAFSSDNKYIVSGHEKSKIDNRIIILWKWSHKNDFLYKKDVLESDSSFRGNKDNINSVAFDPNGEYIVSGSDDNTINLWDRNKKGDFVTSFYGHIDSVNSVAFHPKGKYIISGSADSSIKIWNKETHEAILTLVGFEDGEWIIYTPSNFYYSSERGGEYASFKIGDKLYDCDQYSNIFKNKDIILKKFQGEDDNVFAKIMQKTGINLEKDDLKNYPPPQMDLKIKNKDNNKLEIDNNTAVYYNSIKIDVTIKELKRGLKKIEIELKDANNNLTYPYKKDLNGEKSEKFIEEITLHEGKNNLKVTAYTVNYIITYKKIFIEYRKRRK